MNLARALTRTSAEPPRWVTAWVASRRWVSPTTLGACRHDVGWWRRLDQPKRSASKDPGSVVELSRSGGLDGLDLPSKCIATQMMPWAIIASATFTKAAQLAPTT